MRRFLSLIPISFIALLIWLLKPSWWAIAMIIGGVMFAWDWLWGDRRLLDIRYGVMFMAIGAVLVAIAFVLATRIGLSLGEFLDAARGLPRRAGRLYMLPLAGVGLFLYGLIIFSLAWTGARKMSGEDAWFLQTVDCYQINSFLRLHFGGQRPFSGLKESNNSAVSPLWPQGLFCAGATKLEAFISSINAVR